MKSFKHYLIEVKRNKLRANRLLDYIVDRRNRNSSKNSDQMDNLATPYNFSWLHDPLTTPEDFQKYGKIENVPVRQITTVQDKVSTSVLGSKIFGRWNEHHKYPFVFKLGNNYRLVDGNHRVNVALLKGEKTIKCKVIDVTDNPKWFSYRDYQERNTNGHDSKNN